MPVVVVEVLVRQRKEFQADGLEVQTELLKRMEYREETRKCGNCKYYYRSMDGGNISKCRLIPFIDLGVNEDGYCSYYQQAE